MQPSVKDGLFFYTEGAKPITKNIRVINERGEMIGETYPKRAKGLIKHGRARFVDERTICLPGEPGHGLPDTKNLEDKPMLNIPGTIEDRSNGPRPAAISEPPAPTAPASPAEPEAVNFKETGGGALTMEWVMRQFEKIADDNKYTNEALETIKNMGHSIDGSVGMKANAVKDIIKTRDETNRQLLVTLNAMYAQLNPDFQPQSLPPVPPLNPIPAPPQHQAPASFAQMINAIRGVDWSDLPDEIHDAITEAMESKKLKPNVLKEMLDEIKKVDWDDVPDEVRESVAEGFRNSIM